MKSDRIEDWKQKELGLKPGDSAFFICSDWGETRIVTITGECEEGNGYEASYTEKDVLNEIHTCNGFLTNKRKVARQEAVRLATIHRARLKEEQGYSTKMIHFLDWFIYNGGRE